MAHLWYCAGSTISRFLFHDQRFINEASTINQTEDIDTQMKQSTIENTHTHTQIYIYLGGNGPQTINKKFQQQFLRLYGFLTPSLRGLNVPLICKSKYASSDYNVYNNYSMHINVIIM